jgi:hypothetical protein
MRIGADDPGIARLVSGDFDVLWAQVLALGAQRRLGARLDPASAALLRRHLHEALLALRLGVDEGCAERAWFEAYVLDLIRDARADEHPLDAAAIAATRRALFEAGLPEARELPAVLGVREHLALMTVADGLGALIASLPADWDVPAPSPDFAARL